MIYFLSLEGYAPFLPESHTAIAMFTSKERAIKLKDEVEIRLRGSKGFLFKEDIFVLKTIFPDLELDWELMAHTFIQKIVIDECKILTKPVNTFQK